ncbi:MAG: NADH:ubiquinone oxidoreductase [Nanoarchaeota archaeon]
MTLPQRVPEKKLKVGIFGITGCMGCHLNIIYQKELFDILGAIDLKAFPVTNEKNIMDNDFDIIFLEGVVVNEKDLEELKNYRNKTNKLIAIGSCATDGCVPAIKNFINNKNIELTVYNSDELKELKSLDPKPIDEFVTVDGYIRGCPMDKIEFLQFIKSELLGKEFKIYQKPICYECNLRERGCLLEEGKECLGPITFGNCSVMCPMEGYGCVGCRGPYEDANFNAYFKLLEEKGVSKEETFRHINRFAGIKFQRAMIDKSKNMKDKGVGCCYDMFCNAPKNNILKK